MEPSILSFIDVLQVTPQLLKACEARLHTDGNSQSDVKSLRLVNRQARRAGLQAVTGCCVTLDSSTGSVQKNQQLAKLLMGSPLQRLRVEVTVAVDAAGLIVDGHLSRTFWQRVQKFCSLTKSKDDRALLQAGPSPAHPYSPNPLHSSSPESPRSELSSHASNLNAFVDITRNSLLGVKSVQIILHADSLASHPGSQKHSISMESIHALSNAAGTDLADILAQACPRLQRLSIGGAIGEAALRVLGAGCHSLTRLELLDSCTPGSVLLRLMQQKALPNITHITLSDGEGSSVHDWNGPHSRNLQLVAAVCACTKLTHLRTGEHHLSTATEWQALPATLQELHCHRLPLGRIPPNLMLPNLRRLEIHDYVTGIGASQLLSLLPAAPKLQSLSMTSDTRLNFRGGCWLILRPCPAEAIPGLQMLHQRVVSGLALDQSFVRASTLSEERLGAADGVVSVREILITLDCFPRFTHCELLDNRVYPISAARSAGLGMLGVTLPGLTYLHMSGIWREADINLLMGGKALRTLSLGGLHGVDKAALVRVVLRMPWLHSLEHNSRIVSTTTTELQAMLCGVRGKSGGSSGGVTSADGACLSQEEAAKWVVHQLKKHRLAMLERWCTPTAAEVMDRPQTKRGWFGLGADKGGEIPHL